jgi:two-component system, cell cycle response regulator
MATSRSNLGGSERIRILVADDSAVSRKLVEHALEAEFCELLFAKDGREALQIIADSQPHIVITDWMMPDTSGLELCKKIREESKSGYTYIILLTSSSDLEKLVEGLAAGADDYLTKPFHEKELLARIGVGRRIIAMHREIETKNRLLEKAARTDHLTGLPNRRAVEEYARKQLSGATRYKFPVWVIAADLDGFKLINDTYGHSAGDEVLRHFASILKANTRAADICGRLGGDEFILMLTHVEKKDIPTLVERLRATLASHDFNFEGNETHIGASFGCAGLEVLEPKEFGELLAEADVALYRAKAEKRRVSPAEHVKRT